MVKRTLTALLLTGGMAWAEPTGPQVIHGGVNIQQLGPTTQINQSTDRAIINWNGFNIDVHELVRFVQPDQLSVILNRVVGGDPSTILGQMQANGRVFLVNPNGVVFGPSARVDVGGLMATTLNLSDQDFLAGNYRLAQDPGRNLAAVINQGELKVADGGFLLLVAPTVDNEGVIVARAGQVGLVGSTQATINFDGQGLIEVAIPQSRVTEPGTVLIPQAAVSELLRQVVTDPGIREATRLPGGEGLVLQAGRVDVSGQQQGGRVLVHSGQASLMTETGTILANGARGGGQVLFLSRGLAHLNGRTEARGQQGGFVELSGQDFALRGSVDVSGQAAAGRFLIDPGIVHITDNTPASLDDDLPNILLATDDPPNEVSRVALESMPAGTNITIEADSAIIVEDMPGDLIALAQDVFLNLYVANGILVFNDTHDEIATSGGGGFNFYVPNGPATLGSLTASGGSVNITTGGDLSFHNLNTSSGPVELTSGGNLYLGGVFGGTMCLEAEGHILSDGTANVVGDAASFVAGGKVGTPADPIGVSVLDISGLASEFNFSFDGIPNESLVCGVTGLNVRPVPTPSPPTPPPSVPPAGPNLASSVNTIPVFQINEQTQIPPQPPEPVTPPGPAQQTGSPDDSLAQVAAIPNVSRVSPTEFRLSGNDILPFMDQLYQQGWRVTATEERVFARKGDVQMVGTIGPDATQLRVGPAPTYDLDQPLRDALAFVYGLPGYQVTSEQRVADVYSLQVQGTNVMPLFDGLAQRGWVVRVTADRIEASQGDLLLHGERTAFGANLQVRRQPGPEAVWQDFNQLLAQLGDGQPHTLDVNPYSLTALLETLGQQGWMARMTQDRLLAQKGGQQLQGVIEGNTATLRLASSASTAQSGPRPDPLDFLAGLPGLSSRQRLLDYQRFTYRLGPEGLMPWINAFRDRGFRLRATADRFEASQGDVVVQGAVVGQTFILKIGNSDVFQPGDADADLQGALSWLKQTDAFPIRSEVRLVDRTRVNVTGDLAALRQQLTQRGWTFSADGMSATSPGFQLHLKADSQTISLTVERNP